MPNKINVRKTDGWAYMVRRKDIYGLPERMNIYGRPLQGLSAPSRSLAAQGGVDVDGCAPWAPEHHCEIVIINYCEGSARRDGGYKQKFGS